MTDAQLDSAEWRPGGGSMVWWSVLALVIAVIGLIVYSVPVWLRTGQTKIGVGFADLMVVIVLLAVVVIIHEGIHGLVMLAFGASPRFGATVIAKAFPALYATAPGHRFTRRQYLVIALAPALIISVAGFALAFASFGGYVVVPMALHLSGCTGDFIASSRVLGEPDGTLYEDLRDGIRFWRASPPDASAA